MPSGASHVPRFFLGSQPTPLGFFHGYPHIGATTQRVSWDEPGCNRLITGSHRRVGLAFPSRAAAANPLWAVTDLAAAQRSSSISACGPFVYVGRGATPPVSSWGRCSEAAPQPRHPIRLISPASAPSEACNR
jgi:hypothetical protein